MAEKEGIIRLARRCLRTKKLAEGHLSLAEANHLLATKYTKSEKENKALKSSLARYMSHAGKKATDQGAPCTCDHFTKKQYGFLPCGHLLCPECFDGMVAGANGHVERCTCGCAVDSINVLDF